MFADIDPFASAVLQCRFPHVPNVGDFTKIGVKHHVENIDLLVGGTPCQAFSMSGHRRGMDDSRGKLSLEFIRLIERIAPRWVLWENVSGVLQNDRGRALGSFLGALAQCGYGFAYRVLDAQYFGVAQQRRRIFVVGHSGGDWRRAAAVLFERDIANMASKTSEVEPTIIESIASDEISNSVRENSDAKKKSIVVLKHGHDCNMREKHIMPTLTKNDGGWAIPMLLQNGELHKCTSNERERLMGFPDDWTLVIFKGKVAEDKYRWQALGNSMAVPVMAWLGSRIAAVDQIESSKQAVG